jgi:XTP/dITP diphosphohydrolase
VHSARFAAESTWVGNSSDVANLAKLLRLLETVPAERRQARFRCVIAVVQVADGIVRQSAQLFSGRCEGRIGTTPKGTSGFGYDPVFIPEGHTMTFSEMPDGLKNSLSHRRHALDAMRRWLDETA